MEQLTKNQAVATSQEAVQNQNEPQLRDENAHNDKSVHGVLNPTYQAGLRRDAVQDRKSGSAGMPRPISYAVFCLKKKKLVTMVISAPLVRGPAVTSSQDIHLLPHAFVCTAS